MAVYLPPSMSYNCIKKKIHIKGCDNHNYDGKYHIMSYSQPRNSITNPWSKPKAINSESVLNQGMVRLEIKMYKGKTNQVNYLEVYSTKKGRLQNFEGKFTLLDCNKKMNNLMITKIALLEKKRKCENN